VQREGGAHDGSAQRMDGSDHVGLTADAVAAVQAEPQLPVGEWVATATEAGQDEKLPFNTGLPAAVPAVFNVPAPLINPLQTAAPPPSSTVVEPPRSPQPVKRSSPDERPDDERDSKRVRPDEVSAALRLQFGQRQVCTAASKAQRRGTRRHANQQSPGTGATIRGCVV
jgi:hypothetical protein